MTKDALDTDMVASIHLMLGEIKGTQEQILKSIDNHAGDDKTAFEAISDRFEAQDKKIADLISERDRAKGAGAAIMILLGSAATFIGGAVMAVLEGWIKFRFQA